MDISRRSVLAGGATIGASALAGCIGGGGGDKVEELPTPTIGQDDAPVTVQAFEDFACPHCGTFALEILPAIVEEYVEPGDVRYEHHDFPLGDPTSTLGDPSWRWQAASAARAVQDAQGDEAFFQFVKGIYLNIDKNSVEVLGALADQLGVDRESVESAARELRYQPVLEADKSLGKEMGVRGTPTVFVNGSKVESYAFQRVSAAIESEL